MNRQSHLPEGQLPLFSPVSLPELSGVPAAGEGREGFRSVMPKVGQRALADPNLLAARRLSRQIRRLREHSAEQTQTGLAICRALKAYLQDQADRAH
ncbi:MAG TPA: hypothetical protein VIS76_16270 [Pseudomonadales bacterium]